MSTSSVNTTEPAFIALVCIIPVLTIALVLTIAVFCCRYYSYQKTKLKTRYKKHGNIFEKNFSTRNYQQPIIPISMTPTSGSAYSVRSTEQLFSHRYENDQTSSIDQLPSRRLQQSIIDAYLNDLHSCQPSQKLNVEQLNSYLFVDLHSTSSETLPDTISKVFTDNVTIDFDGSMYDETQRRYHEYLKQQQGRYTVKSKQPSNARFIMRERSLPNNLRQLPQLRDRSTERRHEMFGQGNINDSSSTTNTQNLQSTDTSNETNNYEDIHDINPNTIIHSIEEKKSIMTSPQYLSHFVAPPLHYHYNQPQYYFEKVSTSNIDDSDIEVPYNTFPTKGKGIIYTNDTIIV